MNLRIILLLTALAVLMAGCVANPGYPYNDYGDDYYDYRDTPSYEGYYYARIIFIGNVPYYVDDDRAIRPIPPRLYDHFRRYPYQNLHRPPVFSRDREVRDGYPMSHIIYLNGVPYNVGNDRKAQPLPDRLQPRFRYTPDHPGPAIGNQPQHFDQRDNGRNNPPPAFVPDRSQDRDRSSDRSRDERGPNAPNPGQMVQPQFERGQRDNGRDTPAAPQGGTPPSPDNRGQPHQDQPNANPSHSGNPIDSARDRNGSRPQAAGDKGRNNADKQHAEKKNPDDRNKDQKKKPGEEETQKDNDRGDSNRRD